MENNQTDDLLLMRREHCLKMVEEWVDPYLPPVIETYENFLVVRDDLLGVGSKVRFIDYLIKSEGDEWVYGGSSKVGWGAISLTHACNRHNKKATFFMADRKVPTWHQQKVLDMGGDIQWVKNGMLSVTEYRAKKHYYEDTTKRRMLPSGFDHPAVIGSIIKTAIRLDVEPTEVWSTASSGTLSRGLQLAFPDVPVFAVETGHTLSEYQKGRATVFKSLYNYDKPVKQDEEPPYPSESYCDAKIWSFIKRLAKPGALIWNVA